MQPEQLAQMLQPLVDPTMGWYLAFPGHEDGGELEPFVWDMEQQGDLNWLNLSRSEGWVKPIAVDQVLSDWRQPERIGAVSGSWLVPERDAAGILLDSATQDQRDQRYQELLQWLQTNLQNLQALQLSCDPDYALTVVVGQLDDCWIGVAPTVPIATPVRETSPIQSNPIQSSPIQSTMATDCEVACEAACKTAQSDREEATPALHRLLDGLGTIQLYGYYGGGYGQIHDYSFVSAIGDSQAHALEQTLSRAGWMSVRQFQQFQPNRAEADTAAKFGQLAQFLQQTFAPLWVYRFSFWNYEHFYIIGEADRVWGGVVLRSRFTYNP